MTEITFTTEEAIAVARLVRHLIDRDGKPNPNETAYFSQALTELDLTAEMYEEHATASMDEVFEIVRHMSYPKRQVCARMLRLAVTSDGKVELTELSRLNDILEEAALFRPDKKNLRKSEGGF